MSEKTKKSNSNRRDFIKKNLLLVGLLGIGCGKLSTAASQEIKKLTDSGMSFDDVFKFTLSGNVTLLKGLEKQIGKEKFIPMIQKSATEMTVANVERVVSNLPARGLNEISKLIQSSLMMPPHNQIHTTEIIENTEEALEIKYTKCLFCEVYKGMDAAEIGHAAQCYPSKAVANAFNPDIKFSNPKNMMKGDDYCIERYELKG